MFISWNIYLYGHVHLMNDFLRQEFMSVESSVTDKNVWKVQEFHVLI